MTASVRGLRKHNNMLDYNSNTFTEATSAVSLPTNIVEESLIMSSWESGAIIGIGGVVINTITWETGVSIKVHTKGFGLVKLKGKQAGVESALEIIKTFVASPVFHHAKDWVPSNQLI